MLLNLGLFLGLPKPLSLSSVIYVEGEVDISQRSSVMKLDDFSNPSYHLEPLKVCFLLTRFIRIGNLWSDIFRTKRPRFRGCSWVRIQRSLGYRPWFYS